MLERNEVEHNSRNVYFRSQVGAAEAGSKIKLGIRLRTCQSIQSVLMRGWHDRFGEKLFTLTTKNEWSSEEKFYSITLDLPEKAACFGIISSSQPRKALVTTEIIRNSLVV